MSVSYAELARRIGVSEGTIRFVLKNAPSTVPIGRGKRLKQIVEALDVIEEELSEGQEDNEEDDGLVTAEPIP